MSKWTPAEIHRFGLRESQGICTNGPEYDEWEKWALELTSRIGRFDEANKYLSSTPPQQEGYAELLDFASEKRPDAVHILISNMAHCGVSWTHLSLLASITGKAPHRHHPGDYLAQIADWLRWYGRQSFRKAA